ncbi:TIR domain-containing protein [Streptomyces sp. NPDC093970]|uniref:toll/interleukin-1 receptor domain-containing protein n=1 Tax=Streptomyces sp. NPDC093970 TaxID=3155076 RepID=UPI0034332417
MHHVFVSYSRRDQAWVDRLVHELDRREARFWIDRQGIPFSVPWREEVEDAVQSCDMFLVCDSEHWRASTPCATEAAYALRFDKVRLDVEVGQDVDAAAERVSRMLRHSGRLHGTATELSVRARDWDRAGRAAKALAPRRLRRRYEASRGERRLTPVESAFLRASRGRSRRRAAVSVALTFLLALAYLSARVAPATEKEVNARLAHQADVYLATRAALNVIEDDPYKGLELAAARGGNESAAYAVVAQEALSVGVPDDAFTLPEPGLRFTDPTVSAQVRVTAEDGSGWARGADDRDRRSAHRVSGDPAAGPGRPATGGGNLELRVHEGSARVQVLRRGELWRTVVLDSAARTARISPDARWAAVATDRGVALVDLSRGTERDVLRGAPAPVTDVVWAGRGDRIWALAGRGVVSWPFADGAVVLDLPDEWFQAVLPARDQAHLWVVSRSGRLRMLARDSAAVVRTLDVEGPVTYAADDHRGRNAAVVDVEGEQVRIVDLATGATHAIAVPDDCTPARPVFSRTGAELYVPCLYGDVLLADVRSRRVTGRIAVPDPGVNAVAPAPSGDRLLLGSGSGDVYTVDARAGASPTWLYRVGCGPDIEAIATGPGPRILPVGKGTGLSGCTQTARTEGDGSLRWNAFIDSPPDSVLALAAAYDPTGRAFAIGYSDGSVFLRPSDGIEPHEVLTHIAGGVRSMLTLPARRSDGSTGDLYVATRAGLLVRLPWCPSCLSNKAMARVAAQRLRSAASLGLYTAPPVSPSPTPTGRNST